MHRTRGSAVLAAAAGLVLTALALSPRAEAWLCPSHCAPCKKHETCAKCDQKVCPSSRGRRATVVYRRCCKAGDSRGDNEQGENNQRGGDKGGRIKCDKFPNCPKRSES